MGLSWILVLQLMQELCGHTTGNFHENKDAKDGRQAQETPSSSLWRTPPPQPGECRLMGGLVSVCTGGAAGPSQESLFELKRTGADGNALR